MDEEAHRCDVCKIGVSSAQFLKEHIEGKSHHRALAQAEALRELAEHSIFLTNFAQPPTEKQVRAALLPSAGVDAITRVILDHQGGKFAIVEFSQREIVQALLACSSLKIGESTIKIKPRKVEFEKSNSVTSSQDAFISRSSIHQLLSERKSSNFGDDVDLLIRTYRLPDEKVNKRHELVAQLTNFANEYFDSPVRFVLFGSTITGFALADADMDICFIPESSESLDGYDNKDLAKALLDQSISALRQTKISVHAFNSIIKSDQIRLLTRILNEYRKESGTIRQLSSVAEARCPVIRFVSTAAGGVHCEVSVHNRIGVHKGNFVRQAIGDGELARVLFLVRVWARCSLLFYDASAPLGRWTSYSISLIFVCFCQQAQLLGPLEMRSTNDAAATNDGLGLDFYVTRNTSADLEPMTLLQSFLKFLATVFNRKCVLSVRDGRVYSHDEFKACTHFERYAHYFKFALVTVQDPLEPAHNVTVNVSQHYLNALRSRSVAALCHLHDQNMRVAALFTFGAVKRSAASSTSNVLTASVRVPPTLTIDEFAAVIRRVCEDVLLLEAVRQTADSQHTFAYVASCPTWVGRRKVRREVLRGASSADFLEIERAVTAHIVQQFNGSFTPVHFEFTLSTSANVQEGEATTLTMEKTTQNDAIQLFHFLTQFLSNNLETIEQFGHVNEKMEIDN